MMLVIALLQDPRAHGQAPNGNECTYCTSNLPHTHHELYEYSKLW